MDLIETKKQLMIGFLVFSYIMSHMPAAGGFKYFMWYLRSQQYIVHLPMLYTVLPANAIRYFELIFPIVTFNLIPREYLALVPFSFDMDSQRKFAEESMHDQSEDLGYDTFNAILILGTIWLFSVIWMARVAIYYVSKWIRKHLRNIKRSKYEGGDNVVHTRERPVYYKVGDRVVKSMVTENFTPAEPKKVKKPTNYMQ